MTEKRTSKRMAWHEKAREGDGMARADDDNTFNLNQTGAGA